MAKSTGFTEEEHAAMKERSRELRSGRNAFVFDLAGRPKSAGAAPLRSHTFRAMLNRVVQYSPAIDRAFSALADPTPRAVLERLASGSATISELAEPYLARVSSAATGEPPRVRAAPRRASP